MSDGCERIRCCCTVTLVYKRLNVAAGDAVELMCNTSQSADIMWTYNNDTEDGYVQYVYWKGMANSLRLSAKSRAADVHSLVVDDAEPTDSGLYDCYDDKGLRQVGYQLIVNGMFYFFVYHSNIFTFISLHPLHSKNGKALVMKHKVTK